MSWTLLVGLVLISGIALFTSISRRADLVRMEDRLRKHERAVRQGSANAQLQHPVIDLSRCLGCGTCVAVCPEDNVLELVHGQAMVVNGARCEGISACERECPVGAITVTLANLAERTDIPALSEELEAVGTPGLFLAGEVTAHALIKTAIDHGVTVGAEVARRVAAANGDGNGNGHSDGVLDLVVVGAGPAGLACSLEAKRHGLRFVTLDREFGPGGTVARYPRRKLVLTRPVELPLHGRLDRDSYSKEELIEIWRGVVEKEQLPIRYGEVFSGLERDAAGHFVVHTETGSHTARNVCLAIGRRGIPRELGVPGEGLAKVTHSLVDAHSYQHRRILVVGGGDSAVEAAMALAEQPGNRVTLSYRKAAFFRIRGRTEKRLAKSLELGKIELVFRSRVLAIGEETVELEVDRTRDDREWTERMTLQNDDVFVMAGGVLPFELLERSGVSFDPALRRSTESLVEEGTGLTRALAAGFVLSLVALIWAGWHWDYYWLEDVERPAHLKHDLLRPSKGAGLWLGGVSLAMIGLNLAYLLRRSPRFEFSFGSLRLWMTSHVATGILAFLCATLHAAMSPRNTVGGHAYWALAALLVTGAIGRYFYAYVPRAANGRELELSEVRARLARMAESRDASERRFHERAQTDVLALIESRQWRGRFVGRIVALFGARRDLTRVLTRLAARGARQGISDDQVQATLSLARRAHRTALMAAHYEDLRGVLGSWRYLHRWIAALMVLLVAVHVFYALVYGESSSAGGYR